MRKSLLISIVVVAECNLLAGYQSSATDQATKTPSAPGIVYRNPRVYNVDYTFEMLPDPNNIDRARDLKVWIPIPREWDSQKAVKIISVQPKPHSRYVDPEYGNPMLFWDFGKEPEQSCYKVDIKFRLESYRIDVEVDPNRVGSYDKTDTEYTLYTRSTHTISLTPKLKELAQNVIGSETNPYLQAKKIVAFTKRKVHFKVLDFDRGRGIQCLLDYPVVDEKSGEVYYEGCCNQSSALMVAMCRAVGIPARCISGYIGWNPSIREDNVKARHPFETKLSPQRLSATQLYSALGAHMWAEFFIPNYGWIPVDGDIGGLHNRRWITSKGRDIELRPDASPKGGDYGANWVKLHKGRADLFSYGVLNIGKISRSKLTLLHTSDPFPADGLVVYGQKPFAVILNGKISKEGNWRQDVLSLPSCTVGSPISETINLDQFYEYQGTKNFVDAFVCDMLRRELGDDSYFKLVERYMDLRQTSHQAVSTRRFQELAEEIHGHSLEWFFHQWLNSHELPRLSLDNVTMTKNRKGWRLKGHIRQSNETPFRVRIELAIDTNKARERRALCIDKKSTEFDFIVQDEPRKLIVDPDYNVLKIQRIAPRLLWFWYVYPEYVVIYGTQAETTVNKSTAEQFNLSMGQDKVKADTEVTDTDLENKWVFLIGRPETNKIAQQFKDSFPIRFGGNKFAWEGALYDKPTQGVTQVIENPKTHKGYIVMYAALSPEAMLTLCNLHLYGSDSSYVIFDGDKQLVAGDWQDVDSNLYWSLDKEAKPL